MGRLGMVGKHLNLATQGGGGWPGNFTGKITSPCSSSLANVCARVVAGDAPTAKTRLVYKWIKTTQFGVQGFGEFSLGLWSSKWV